ncbi:Hypothetical protein CINCED_3A013172 [Cinara cedri]|nr:Hypothetical protein CINCED_3A013172 [Cinara cedri]
MCIQRDKDDPGDIVFPYPLLEFIDLTELTEDEVLNINLNDRNEANWNPYNPLPSSDEDEPEVINNDDDDDDDDDEDDDEDDDDNNSVRNTEPDITDDSSNETNQLQDINPPIIPRSIREIHFEINPIQDFRHFELNVPQILMSMSRISHELFEDTHPPSP